MKYIFTILAANIPSIICLSGTVYFLANNIPNWGWLLFAGVIIFVSPKKEELT